MSNFKIKVPKSDAVSKRNLVRQVIELKDKEGNVIGRKAVFHPKPTHAPQFRNYKQAWDGANTTAKYKSKRQQRLRIEKLKQLQSA